MAVKGPLHARLRKTLSDAVRLARETGGGVTQISLSAALSPKGQTAIGKYLNEHPKAGALDLDEADAALRHIGSTLEDFLKNNPPHELTHAERMARELLTRPELAAFIEDLLPVPKTQLGDVLETARNLGRLASGQPLKRGGGSRTGKRAAKRTKSARVPHR